SEAELAQMVRLELNKKLPAIAGSGNLETVAFQLIEKAETEGWLTELVEGALAANLHSPELLEVAPLFGVARSEGQAKPFVSVPPRNAVFTGREDVLDALHKALAAGNAALTPMPFALRGLGGIGKTQTAAEYAYRHRSDYEAIFWVIGETPEQLAS